MERSPRPVGAPVLSTSNWVRLCVQGAVMTVGALVAYQIGESNSGRARVASTMLLTTLSLFHLRRACWRATSAHDLRPARHPRADAAAPVRPRLLLAIILVTEIGFLQRIFSMVDLTLEQWGICIGIALEPRGGRGADQALHPAPRADRGEPADPVADRGWPAERRSDMAFNLRNRSFLKELDFTPTSSSSC